MVTARPDDSVGVQRPVPSAPAVSAAPPTPPTSPTPARRRRERLRPAVMAAMAGVLAATVLGSFSSIFGGDDWWWASLAVIGAVAGVGVLTRLAGVPSGVVILLQLVAAAGMLFAQMWLAGAPLGAWGRNVPLLIDQGVDTIANSPAPIPVSQGLFFLIILMAAILAVLFDATVLPAHLPLLVGIPVLAALVTPGIVLGTLPGLSTTVVAFAAFLVLVLASRGGSIRMLWAVPAIAGVTVVALLTPSVLTAWGLAGAASQSLAWQSGYAPLTGSSPSPLLELGKDLRRPAQIRALTYSTDTGQPQYLGMAELSDFSGTAWRVDPDDLTKSTELPEPSGISERVRMRTTNTAVTIAGLGSSWLPMPASAQDVEGLPEGWSRQEGGLTVRSTSTITTEGMTYSVESASFPWQYRFTRDGFSVNAAYDPGNNITEPGRAPGLAESGEVPAELEKYLEVPAELPSEITEVADLIAAKEFGPGSPLIGVALQEYFSRTGGFSYSLDTPVRRGFDGDGVDMIAQFLTVRSGYCIHFSSAMAIVARELGVPSRIVVGYAPGSQLSDTTASSAALFDSDENEQIPVFEASNNDLHAWPELYFEGYGWLAFEPTVGGPGGPSGGAGGGSAASGAGDEQDEPAESSDAAESSDDDNSPSRAEDDEPEPSETPEETEEAAAPSGTSTPAASLATGWLFAAVLVVLLAAAPALLRVRRRAVRRRADSALAGGSAYPAWSEVEDLAVDWGLADIAERGERAVYAALVREFEIGDKTAAELWRVVVAAERERYARPAELSGRDPALPVGEVTGYWHAVRALRGELRHGGRGSTGLWLRAALLPASVLNAWLPRRPSRILR